MFWSSSSPLGRMRSSGCKIRSDNSTQLTALSSKSSMTGSLRNGDYAVLRSDVDKRRRAVHETRSALAISLDRMGEHHVRQKEYDEAMDAFAEALHEKRSAFAQIMPSSDCPPLLSRRRADSNGDTVFDLDMVSPEVQELHDQTLDEIVKTLRNMGNVHSLRGEQDEAMRYFSEVTGLKATKMAFRDNSSVGSGQNTSFSGMWGDEDNSTLMSEINEDVKALDDLFRSISFRNGESNGERRGSGQLKPLAPSKENVRKRRRDDGLRRMENEPFKRSSSLGSRDSRGSTSSSSTTATEVDHALDTYRIVLDSYQGALLDQHLEQLNSFVLRADLMNSSSQKINNKPTAEELQLALDIYKEVLSAQKETRERPLQDTDDEPDASANIASTLIRMGSLFYKLNEDVDSELLMYQEARAVYEAAFGENHSNVAGTIKNIGMVLAERGEYEEALKNFEDARSIYLNANEGDEKNRDVASTISCMGNVHNRRGELDTALDHYTRALRIYTLIREEQQAQVVDDGSPRDTTSGEVAATLKIIGVVYSKKGNSEKALQNFTAALNVLKSSDLDTTDAGKETTASILTRIAGIFFKQSELDKSMAHYREAYEKLVEVHGTTHPDVASILHYMGSIQHKRKDYNDAMTCYQEAVRIYHSTLGTGNPAVAATLVCIGSIHYKQRSLDSAMMFYREALRLNRDAYGLHHPDVAPTLKSIGTILTKQGSYDEAYDVFRDVLSIKCTVHGTDHPEVANAYKSLGNVHYKRGELSDAERSYRHALRILRRTRGESHPDTISARTSIEHIRYWMKERGQQDQSERRNAKSSKREHERAENSDSQRS